MVRLLIAALFFVISAAGAPFSSLYFFGDSLTDTGNVHKATSTLARYTFGLVPEHPSSPYVDGRFTNGQVWAEHVADRLGRPQDAAQAGMSIGWFGQVGGTGNNYAVGGAHTDRGGALGLLDLAIPTGVFEQVDFHLSRTGGAADAAGLYFLMAGGNDLRDAARISDGGERLAASQQAAYNLLLSVETLHRAGARQFMLINAPIIGLIPESLSDGLLETGTDASWHFNTSLAWHGNYLRTLPGLSLQYFDLAGLHLELANQYGYGAIRPCKDGPPGACEETLFFDSVHPTARVHQIIGERIADQLLGTSSEIYLTSRLGDTHTPEPSTTILMVTSVGLLVMMRKNRRPKMKKGGM